MPARRAALVLAVLLSALDAVAAEAPAADAADLSLSARPRDLAPLPSPWADYFGTHYTGSPEDAGTVWRTVRSYGGTHVGIPADADDRAADAPPRNGPFTGRPVRVSLRDFRSQSRFARPRTTRSAERLIPELIGHRITGIYNMVNVVRPSMEPFDRDLAYWTVRMIHERFPAAKDCVAWEIGNEVVSGHFNPRGLPKEQRKPGRAPDGTFFGYDLAWKRDYYVHRYLAPAVEAIERASRDVYGDPGAITILLGSMNPYNKPNITFLKEVMAARFDGRCAPSLRGQAVADHVAILNVHYMFGGEGTADRMQAYHDTYLTTGRVRGIWITEEHGAGGKGPVTILDRGMRFLRWVAANRLTAAQARLVWWGEGDRPGGSGKALTGQLGRFFAGRHLLFGETTLAQGRACVLAGADAEHILVAVLPRRDRTVDLATLHLALPQAAADRDWQANAWQYSATTPPEKVSVDVTRRPSGLDVTLSRRLPAPFAVFIRGDARAK